MSSVGLIFGLLTALGWGTSDFFAGFATRRASPLATLVVAQAVAMVITIPIVTVAGGPNPGLASILWGVGAGTGGFLALVFLYRGFAVSPMGPVVAVAAVVGVGLPVIIGPFTGDRLRPGDVLGIACGIAAIVLVTRGGSRASMGRAGIGSAIASGLAAGFYFVLVRESTLAGGGTWWTIMASRSTTLLLAVLVTIGLRQVRSTLRSATRPMVGVGLTDLVGTIFFLLANAQGALSIAAVLASQSPAVTTILARAFLGQHLNRSQAGGIAAALVGVALIALS